MADWASTPLLQEREKEVWAYNWLTEAAPVDGSNLVNRDQVRSPFSQPCPQGICCLSAKGYMASLPFSM